MHQYFRLLFTSSIALVAMSSCNKIRLEEPNYGVFSEMPEHRVSTLNIPINIEFKEIEQLINGKLKEVIYDDTSFFDKNNDGLKLRITRLNDIRLQSFRNKLYLQAPLNVELAVLLRTKVFGRTIQKEKNMTFSARLHLSTAVSMNENWQLVTKLKLDKIEWIEHPDMKFIGIRFNLTKLVENKLAENENMMLSALDKTILEKVNLKMPVNNIWDNLHKPIRINNKVHQVWLMVEPQILQVSPIKMSRKSIQFEVALGSMLSTHIGDLEKRGEASPLPNYQFKEDTSGLFDLHLLGHLPFELINETLKDSLEGKVFIIEGKKLKIKKARISGSGPRVLLRLDIRGDVKGNVYLSGIPHYSHETGIFSINNFSFDLESEEILLQAADWMYHSDLVEKVNQKLHWPIGAHITKLPELISQGISKSKISNKVELKIDSMVLQPSDVVVRPDGLYFQLHATGNAALSVTQLEN